jgi:hypothetical protein
MHNAEQVGTPKMTGEPPRVQPSQAPGQRRHAVGRCGVSRVRRLRVGVSRTRLWWSVTSRLLLVDFRRRLLDRPVPWVVERRSRSSAPPTEGPTSVTLGLTFRAPGRPWRSHAGGQQAARAGEKSRRFREGWSGGRISAVSLDASFAAEPRGHPNVRSLRCLQ